MEQRIQADKHKLLLTIICCLFTSTTLISQENINERTIKLFSDKITHSFGIQYNNCIYPKAQFTNQNPNSNLGWDPMVSYGNEFTLKYNLAFKSGFGFTIEAMKGIVGYRTRNRYDDLVTNFILPFEYVFPLSYNYLGFNLKASYITKINDNLFLQPEIGIKSVYYPTTRMSFDLTGLAYMEVTNLSCHRNFFPELTTSVNFLIHTKRNPRNNFIIGLNMNIGFTPRYKGYYSFTPPFQSEQKNCDIEYKSNYFGINFGYEFIGLPKTFDRKKNRKIREYETFDFNKCIHSVSLLFGNGFGLSTQVKDQKGPIYPTFPSAYYTPEFSLKYSCSFRKGFGFAIEVPIGLYIRKLYTSLLGVVPQDTVWANGVTGPGLEGEFDFKTAYYGLSLKATYITQIRRNIYLQPEIGIKFVPFISPAKMWEESEEFNFFIYDYDTWPETENAQINYIKFNSKIEQKYYYVPDLTLAVNFIFHGKNPTNNFIFGVNANVCFVKRITWSYQATDCMGAEYASSGKFNWNSTAIGLHFGYQFMHGKKIKYENKK